ncbi:MoaD/ThiS family protein [Nocardioides sp. CFH 31398]|uniref:MoaD/ThiS family protein n=1 Tax=Nocardioides sp. CFH 31398 TaxID=2919579 RepID=UPI001F05502F|nr:MoaD/ThiS family protein [Nocardioides sp. CFH 31398]MCH1866026.1 MoaD/ThiS family protein [Nocardioides sp. CFH 31398]
MHPDSTTEARDAAHATPGVVTVHFWAAARAAAGAAEAQLPVDGPTTLAAVTAAVLESHGDDARLRQVLGVCSVLVDDRPAGTGDPAAVRVEPGQSVQYLPPFAGG